jgi:hypothetical protein
LWVIFALLNPDLDPDSEYGYGSTDPISVSATLWMIDIFIVVRQSQLAESHAMLEEACNQKEEKDARIEELEEQVEALQQHRDQLAKDITSLQGKQHGQCRCGYLNRVDFKLLEQTESIVLLK